MTLIALIRHAPTDWNAQGRIQGRSDIPLSDEGRARAASWAVPAALAGFDRVSSPLRRARETAQLLGAADCPSDDRLAETDWGFWEGQVLHELRAQLGETLARNEGRGLDLQPPGGESPRAVRTRFEGWMREIAARGRPTLAVTHNGVIRAAISLATGWDMKAPMEVELAWAAAHLFEADAEGGFAIKSLNLPLASPANEGEAASLGNLRPEP